LVLEDNSAAVADNAGAEAAWTLADEHVRIQSKRFSRTPTGQLVYRDGMRGRCHQPDQK
jgi:hypothetical protein